MLEFYLQSAHGLARARASLVGSYLDDYAAALREIGYCRRIGAWCISYAVHLGLWAAIEGVRIAALDERSVNAFLAHLPRCRCPGQRAGLHVVLHQDEVLRLFAGITNLKHRAISMTIYAAGLRVSEVAHLQVADIDSLRMLIHVRQGKRAKDRLVPLSPALLGPLREYYRSCRP